MLPLDDDIEDFEMVNSEDFSMNLIENSINSNLDIIETIVSFCEENELSMEDVIPLLDKNIIDRIKVCGVENRYIIDNSLNKNKLF